MNLFGYSGIASLDAAIAGASVTHIDASKKAINLAFENRNRNNLETLPIRYLVEDAVSFVKKEINRKKNMMELYLILQNMGEDQMVKYGKLKKIF